MGNATPQCPSAARRKGGAHSHAHSTMSVRVRFNQGIASATKVALCKDCAHFRPSRVMGAGPDLARCAKFGDINAVSGKVTLDFAEVARMHECRGDAFEPRPPAFGLRFLPWPWRKPAVSL
jgi:hypothetical protein